MSINTPHPLKTCWDMSLNSVKADALNAAIHLGLFNTLSHAATAGSVARQHQLDPKNTGYFLDILWSMALLERHRETHDSEWRYCVDPVIAPFIQDESPLYCGQSLHFRLETLRQFGSHLPAFLKNGSDIAVQSTNASWAEAAQAQIAQEQNAVTARAALACINELTDLKGNCRFLDLGGGPGKIAIAIAQAHPSWTGEVFDLPETARVAERTIREAGLENRLTTRSGDIAADNIGNRYDLVWCSSVLHFVPDISHTLHKVFAALSPGGYFVSVHAEIPPGREAAEKILPYYLPLLMRGRHVWPQGTLTALLEETGFKICVNHEVRCFPVAPAQLIIGRKISL